jgi:RNase P subunit RPR2
MIDVLFLFHRKGTKKGSYNTHINHNKSTQLVKTLTKRAKTRTRIAKHIIQRYPMTIKKHTKKRFCTVWQDCLTL